MKTMQSHWEEFRSMVYPNGTTAEQERQVKNTFFSGALMALEEVSHFADLPEDAGAMAYEKLLTECRQTILSSIVGGLSSAKPPPAAPEQQPTTCVFCQAPLADKQAAAAHLAAFPQCGKKATFLHVARALMPSVPATLLVKMANDVVEREGEKRPVIPNFFDRPGQTITE